MIANKLTLTYERMCMRNLL